MSKYTSSLTHEQRAAGSSVPCLGSRRLGQGGAGKGRAEGEVLEVWKDGRMEGLT
jgi:hypothetical protein